MDRICLLCSMLVCVVLSCLFLVVTCWERADLLAVVFCHFPKFVLVHIRIRARFAP